MVGTPATDVEVALLLQSRGLPSSHRQLRWTHTIGLMQVRLEVVAIGISNIAAFVRAGKTSLSISFYSLTLSKAKQRFRAEVFQIPHLLQSPNGE
jgi:hypothetical protein